MTELGKSEFPSIMEKAILEGNEVTLAIDLANPKFWLPYINTKTGERKLDPKVASKLLALTEFNTWYVRGFSRRLKEEGVEFCEVYRAAPAEKPRPECLDHDGEKFKVIEVYNGHRARYHPIENKSAFSIPIGPNCHHTIRRLKVS